MANDYTEFKRQSFKWIKAESGTTYICPVDALQGNSNPSDEELSADCVDESLNPQND